MENSEKPILVFRKKEKLSPEQEKFNRLTDKIKRLTDKITDTEQSLERCRVRVDRELRPLMENLIRIKVRFLQMLDDAYRSKTWTFTEKRQLQSLMMRRCEELLFEYQMPDSEAVSEIYEFYKKENQDPFEAMDDLFQTVVDIPLQTYGAFFESMHDLYFGESKKNDTGENSRGSKTENLKDTNQDAPEQDSEEPRIRFHEEIHSVNHKGKSNEADGEDTLRKLYKQLVKALHPDTESDPEEAERKTELMKTLSQAYKNKDLFELLGFYAKYLGKEAKSIIPKEQIRAINDKLRKQLSFLEFQLQRKQNIGEEGFLFRKFGTEEKQQERRIKRHKKELENELIRLKREIEVIRKDGINNNVLFRLRM